MDKRLNWLHSTKSDCTYFTFPWWLTLRKKLRYWLILFRGIDDQRMLQSDWTRDAAEYNKTKVVASDTALMVISMQKKCKVLIDSLKWYWWKKNTVIWSVGSILGHNWKIRFSQTYRFRKIIKNIMQRFWAEKRHINGSNFWQKPTKKSYLSRLFELFPKM